ncbi:MAG: hypothetical protein M3O15_14915, partial [Acidobacteriota bacterium]|nr:hypothetical protein [Acidobacteriota bacterium]
AGVGIVVNLLFTATRDALLGTTVLLLGIPAYLFWRRLDRRRPAAPGPAPAPAAPLPGDHQPQPRNSGSSR